MTRRMDLSTLSSSDSLYVRKVPGQGFTAGDFESSAFFAGPVETPDLAPRPSHLVLELVPVRAVVVDSEPEGAGDA